MSADEPTEVVRLTVNLAPSVAAALQMLAALDGVTVTEEIRLCIKERHDVRFGRA